MSRMNSYVKNESVSTERKRNTGRLRMSSVSLSQEIWVSRTFIMGRIVRKYSQATKKVPQWTIMEMIEAQIAIKTLASQYLMSIIEATQSKCPMEALSTRWRTIKPKTAMQMVSKRKIIKARSTRVI